LKWCRLAFGLVLSGLSGCGLGNAPGTYTSNLNPQVDHVAQGIIVAVRRVGVNPMATAGVVSDAAVSDIAGSSVGVSPVSATTALGGFSSGGFTGAAAKPVSVDLVPFE
jgi:outer membrane lipoprotein SlyB